MRASRANLLAFALFARAKKPGGRAGGSLFIHMFRSIILDMLENMSSVGISSHFEKHK
jgi:hypothetical protein